VRRLSRSALPADTVELARFLLGVSLVSEGAGGRCSVRIVETEAYVVGDAASHAARGKTPRSASMYLRRGHAYVYFIYGTWFCLNVSSEAAGSGAAVLLRAGEPTLALEVMRARRGANVPDRDLCRGPGRLAQALAVTRLHDGLDLCAPGPLWLATDAREPAVRRVGTSVRIGLTKEAERVLRFFEPESPYVSGPAKLNRA
jgi:DNA-3-methyladenine glycosylase